LLRQLSAANTLRGFLFVDLSWMYGNLGTDIASNEKLREQEQVGTVHDKSGFHVIVGNRTRFVFFVVIIEPRCRDDDPDPHL